MIGVGHVTTPFCKSEDIDSRFAPTQMGTIMSGIRLICKQSLYSG
jgi:hypothetical protein